MITLLAQPNALVFAQNPIVFRLHAAHTGGAQFAAIGMSQSLSLTEGGDVVVGANIRITITEGDGTTNLLVFDFVDTPTHDQQLPTYTPNITESFENYYRRIATLMNQAHLLSPFVRTSFSFDSGTSVSTITFTALNVGTTVEIEIEDLANGTVLASVAAIADSTPTNYAAVYEVFGEGDYLSNGFKSLFLGNATPGKNGEVRVNVQNILTAFHNAIKFLPPNATALAIHKADNLRRYYFRFTEKYGAPTIQFNWHVEGIKKILRGGIAQNINVRENWFTSRTLDTCLLNTLPDGRTVAANSPEFLAWFNYTGGSQSLKVEWTMWSNIDGTMSTGVNESFALYVGVEETIMIPALIFHDYQEVAAAIEIRFLDQNNIAVSPWRRYTIDRRYREDERYLMFLNKYGVFETVRMTGAASIGAEMDRRESTRYNNDVMETFEAEKRWRRSFTYRTGYLTQAESLALENLVSSRFVFEVSTTEGYIPLRILDTKLTLDDGKQDIWALEIKAVPQKDSGAPTTDLWVRW